MHILCTSFLGITKSQKEMPKSLLLINYGHLKLLTTQYEGLIDKETKAKFTQQKIHLGKAIHIDLYFE